MSKVIRVEDKTYADLDHLRLGRQTFDDVINNILQSRLKVLELMSILEGQIGYREYQREKLDIVRERADLTTKIISPQKGGGD